MTTPTPLFPGRVAVVGDGRLGNALAAALRDAGLPVDGPLGRGATADGADVVLLCVPDGEIAAAAALIAAGAARRPLLGRHRRSTRSAGHEAFSLHPLMTVTAAPARALRGAGAAIAGDHAARAARPRSALADAARAARRSRSPTRTAPPTTPPRRSPRTSSSRSRRAAERLPPPPASTASCSSPLVRATVDNWAADGADAR